MTFESILNSWRRRLKESYTFGIGTKKIGINPELLKKEIERIYMILKTIYLPVWNQSWTPEEGDWKSSIFFSSWVGKRRINPELLKKEIESPKESNKRPFRMAKNQSWTPEEGDWKTDWSLVTQSQSSQESILNSWRRRLKVRQDTSITGKIEIGINPELLKKEIES